MNIVMTDENKIVEIQGTGEQNPFTREEFNELYTLAEKGIKQMINIQKEVLKMDCLWIGTGGK